MDFAAVTAEWRVTGRSARRLQAQVRVGWVTEEWQRALRSGTPVHVALVRDTKLPAELTTVHDLRGRVGMPRFDGQGR